MIYESMFNGPVRVKYLKRLPDGRHLVRVIKEVSHMPKNYELTVDGTRLWLRYDHGFYSGRPSL